MTPVPPYTPPGGGGGGQTEAEVQAQIDAAVTGLLDGAPGALDTLNELAAALGDDAAFSAHVATAIAGATSDAAAASAAAALVQTHLNDHINDGTAAHTAAAIAIADLHGYGDDLNEVINAGILPQLISTETDVSNALGQAATAQATADNHIADTTNAHAAASIGNTPAGNIAATTVQAALNELDTEKATTGSVSTVATGLSDHLADTSDAHDASAISVLDSGNLITATDVEGALAELATAVAAGGSAPVDTQTFAAGANWTKPTAGQKFAAIFLFGGGGGGGRGGFDAAATTRYGGGGGGAGGYLYALVPLSQLAATEAVVIGTGGAGGTAMDSGSQLAGKVGLPGSNGGNTQFGAVARMLLQAGGGQGGSGGASSTAQSVSQSMQGSGLAGQGAAGHGGGGAFHNPLLGNGQALPTRAGAGLIGAMPFSGGDFVGRMAAKVSDTAGVLSPTEVTQQIFGVGGGGGAPGSDTANAGGSNGGGGRGGGSVSTGNVVRTTGAATSVTQAATVRQGGDGGGASSASGTSGTAGTAGTGKGAGGGGGGAGTSGGAGVSGNGGAGSDGYAIVISF